MNQVLRVSPLSLTRCLCTWISISALLASSVSAQVNGPGPSPSSTFDTVVNLPGDEDVITGASQENIGGNPAETIQLNVSDGGRLGFTFSALSGSEINISGGFVGSSFGANSGSEVNVSAGGSLGSAIANSGSVVNVSGGTVNFLEANSGSVVNISAGSAAALEANSGSEVNISGGSANSFDANSGSVVNISGGIANSFDANPFSEVNISGGRVENFSVDPDSNVELIGGEFRLNGADFFGDTISLVQDDILTATLADGSPLIFHDGVGRDSDSLPEAYSLTVTSVPLPAADLSPMVINTPIANGPAGLRPGQTLTIQSGGSLLSPDFLIVDATLNVEAGELGESAESVNSEINISGGAVGNGFDALDGSVVNISGGIVGDGTPVVDYDLIIIGPGFDAFSGSVVNISGGILDNLFDAHDGSEVNISGGVVNEFSANPGSEVNISGGTLDRGFLVESGGEVNISGGSFETLDALAGSNVQLIGGEFRLNGADYFYYFPITLAEGDVFSGTLADGSAFIFSNARFDELIGVTLALAPLPPVDLNPIVINASNVSGPSGLRADQTLTLEAGGSLRDDFQVVDATLNVEDGIVGAGLEVSGSVVSISGGTVGRGFNVFSDSEVTISGGTVGSALDVFSGSVLNVSGGTVGSFFDANSGSEVNISGGTFGEAFGANSGSLVNISGGAIGAGFNVESDSEVNISGGAIGDNFLAFDGSEVNISGGTFGDDFDAFGGSEVNLFGSEFLIDGVALNGLQLGQAFTIADRDVTLSGVLADGEPFSFDLTSVRAFGDPFFDPAATLTVTLTAPFLLGDCNQNGVVDFEDIGPFIMILQSGSFLAEADCNQDGVVDFLDIESFITILMSI